MIEVGDGRIVLIRYLIPKYRFLDRPHRSPFRASQGFQYFLEQGAAPPGRVLVLRHVSVGRVVFVGDVAVQNGLTDPRFQDAHGYARAHTKDVHNLVAVNRRLEGAQIVLFLNLALSPRGRRRRGSGGHAGEK